MSWSQQKNVRKAAAANHRCFIMNIYHSLLFFFSLQKINSNSANALQKLVGVAGEDIRVTCGTSLYGTWRILCREKCEGENIVITTHQITAQSGRYSTEWDNKAGFSYFTFYVSISALTPSDSGLYICGFGKSSSSATYNNFRLIVVKVGPSASTSTTGGSFRSSSGGFTPSVFSETTVLFQDSTTSEGATDHRSAYPLLFVTLTLVTIINLSFLLVCCRKRSKTHHTENPPAAESSRMKKGFREEDDEWKCADVEIYSAYIETTNTKPTEGETNQGCSFVTATTSQHQGANDSTEVIYAEVKISTKKEVSPPRAPFCSSSDVIYAQPGVDEGSPDMLLYSTIT